jgi:hypothetical protein
LQLAATARVCYKSAGANTSSSFGGAMEQDESSGGTAAETSVSERHLLALRSLLRRDYLTGTGWQKALQELAGMARQALGADEALVGLYDKAAGQWSAFTADGTRLDQADIRRYGSLAVLNRLRRSEQPLLTTKALRHFWGRPNPL